MVSKILYSQPENLGKWTQFDYIIFFRWVGSNIKTRYFWAIRRPPTKLTTSRVGFLDWGVVWSGHHAKAEGLHRALRRTFQGGDFLRGTKKKGMGDIPFHNMVKVLSPRHFLEMLKKTSWEINYIGEMITDIFWKGFFHGVWDFVTNVRCIRKACVLASKWSKRFRVKQNQVVPDADARSFNSFQLESI